MHKYLQHCSLYGKFLLFERLVLAMERGALLTISTPYSVVCFSFQSFIVSCDSNLVHHKI